MLSKKKNSRETKNYKLKINGKKRSKKEIKGF